MSGKTTIKIEARTALTIQPGTDGGILVSLEKFGVTVGSRGVPAETCQQIIAAVQMALESQTVQA